MKKRSHPPCSSLEAFRREHGLSQRDAAKQFQVSQSAWSLWERGIQRPRRQYVKRLVEGTGVPLDVLMGVAS